MNLLSVVGMTALLICFGYSTANFFNENYYNRFMPIGLPSTGYPDRYTLNINHVADRILPSIKQLMKTIGMDPLQVPTVTDQFWVELLFSKHSGIVNLTGGTVRKLATIERCGDATISFKEEDVIVHVLFRFEDLIARFDYGLTSSFFSKEGRMNAIMRNITASVTLKYNLPNFRFYTPVLQIQDIGEIKADLENDSVLDWIGSHFVNKIIPIFREQILGISEKTALTILNDQIGQVNELIKTKVDLAKSFYNSSWNTRMKLFLNKIVGTKTLKPSMNDT